LYFFQGNSLSSQSFVELTQERLDEIEQVSSNLTKVLGSNPALGMQQR